MGCDSVKPISVLFDNIISSLRHRDDLCSVIDSSSADVVLTETWLSSSVKSCEIFCCEKHFNVYRVSGVQELGAGFLLLLLIISIPFVYS